MPRRRTNLQDVLDEAIDNLGLLRQTPIVKARTLNEDDIDDLEALAVLALDLARALDPIFHEIAYQGGAGSRSNASEHAAYVTNAVEGNLDFELRERAERLMIEREAREPEGERRLSAAELGLGLNRRR